MPKRNAISRPRPSSMMLTSLEDNLKDCGCQKRKKLRENLRDRAQESGTGLAALSDALAKSSNLVGDAFRNVARGLGDAVKACSTPILRASSAPPMLFLQAKPQCSARNSQAPQKRDAHADNNNANTINIVIGGAPGNPAQTLAFPAVNASANPAQTGFPQGEFPQTFAAPPAAQTAPFTGAPQAFPQQASPSAPPQEPAPRQEPPPQIIREIIREPVFLPPPTEKIKLVQRIKPKKIYIQSTKNNYVSVHRPTVQTAFDTTTVYRPTVETQYDAQSVVRPTVETQFDAQSVVRPSVVEMSAVTRYLREKKQV